MNRIDPDGVYELARKCGEAGEQLQPLDSAIRAYAAVDTGQAASTAKVLDTVAVFSRRLHMMARQLHTDANVLRQGVALCVRTDATAADRFSARQPPGAYGPIVPPPDLDAPGAPWPMDLGNVGPVPPGTVRAGE